MESFSTTRLWGEDDCIVLCGLELHSNADLLLGAVVLVASAYSSVTHQGRLPLFVGLLGYYLSHLDFFLGFG